MSIKFGSNHLQKLNYAKISKAFDTFEVKVKGTVVEKWVRFWKQLYVDYKEVAVGVRNETKARPIKAFTIATGLIYLGYCNKTNPDSKSFRNAVAKATNDVIQVNPSLVKPLAVQHLRLLERCYNANMIRRFNLGIASIMWVDNHSDTCNTYECTCDYLKLSYPNVIGRIIDIGYINKWWILDSHMKDFDVNY